MQFQPTQEQIESYRRDGFVVIEDFLSPSELEVWRQTTHEAVEQRLDAARTAGRWGQNSATLTNQNNPDDFSAQVFTQCVRLADTHDGMRELMMDKRTGELVGTLAGVDGIRIWHDQALIKPPYGNPTAFHLDNPYWSFSSPGAISIWVALDDATLANGCLWYLPETQKTARYENVGIGPNLRDIFKVYPAWKTIEAQNAACPAGSAVFHSGLVAHGAGANMTPHPRRAMTCGYMPDGSTFNGTKNILPDDYFNRLKIGDVLDNDIQNPLIWKK